MTETEQTNDLNTEWLITYAQRKTISPSPSYCHRRMVYPGRHCLQDLSSCDSILCSERKHDMLLVFHTPIFHFKHVSMLMSVTTHCLAQWSQSEGRTTRGTDPCWGGGWRGHSRQMMMKYLFWEYRLLCSFVSHAYFASVSVLPLWSVQFKVFIIMEAVAVLLCLQDSLPNLNIRKKGKVCSKRYSIKRQTPLASVLHFKLELRSRC